LHTGVLSMLCSAVFQLSLKQSMVGNGTRISRLYNTDSCDNAAGYAGRQAENCLPYYVSTGRTNIELYTKHAGYHY